MGVFDKALKRFDKVAKNRASLIGYPVGTVRFKNGKTWSANVITWDGVIDPGMPQISSRHRRLMGESARSLVGAICEGSVQSAETGLVSYPTPSRIMTGFESTFPARPEIDR